MTNHNAKKELLKSVSELAVNKNGSEKKLIEEVIKLIKWYFVTIKIQSLIDFAMTLNEFNELNLPDISKDLVAELMKIKKIKEKETRGDYPH